MIGSYFKLHALFKRMCSDKLHNLRKRVLRPEDTIQLIFKSIDCSTPRFFFSLLTTLWICDALQGKTTKWLIFNCWKKNGKRRNSVQRRCFVFKKRTFPGRRQILIPVCLFNQVDLTFLVLESRCCFWDQFHVVHRHVPDVDAREASSIYWINADDRNKRVRDIVYSRAQRQ